MVGKFLPPRVERSDETELTRRGKNLSGVIITMYWDNLPDETREN